MLLQGLEKRGYLDFWSEVGVKRLWGEQEGHRGRHGRANTNIRLKELSVRKTLPEDLPETRVDWDS